jgi:XTP/dITP diphosphohydrolase
MRAMAETRELIFGTGNMAKVHQVQDALEGLGVHVRSIKEFDVDLPEVEEDGATVIENARKKAVAYAQAMGRTIFSMDNALYFDGLSDEEQPGLHVRRINGHQASNDEEMVRYYAEFLRNHEGELGGWWEYAVALGQPDGTSVGDVITSRRQFTAEPSKVIVAGYPLESIQIDPRTGKYIAEMTKAEQAKFWQDEIGEPLKAFVTTNL